MSTDQTGGDYEIRTEPCNQRVRVAINGTYIADSTRAFVVHETRLPPAYYFPAADICMDLFEKNEFNTHCPFKGNASYWTLRVGDQIAENVAWAYEDPYPEAAAIRGYLSFYPNKISAIYVDEEEVTDGRESVRGSHGNPLANWLLKDAWKAASIADLAEQFLNFLHDAGYPVARGTVIIPTLHPQIFATVLAWRHDTPGIKTIYEPHDILLQPKFADSPFAPIILGEGGVRRQLESPDCDLDFPSVRELHSEGATDYAAMPFRFSDGQINVMSITSFAKGGFGTAHLGEIYEVLPMLARMFEVHALRRTATVLLDTFVGPRIGARIFKGQVKRGDGNRIQAAFWYSDLRGFTALSESLPAPQLLQLLNEYFELCAAAAAARGGEILQFIGDASLIVFEIEDEDDGDAICEAALDAAVAAYDALAIVNQRRRETALPEIEFGLGLHVGEVTHANVGAPDRLAFNVVGPAVNKTARIQSLTKDAGKPLLVSREFAARVRRPLSSLGHFDLRGVSGTQEVFTLAQ
ncbi:MAG: adenylate cyclase [Gammaproteobacteria bacterium]|jgi:adenylate cyclase